MIETYCPAIVFFCNKDEAADWERTSIQQEKGRTLSLDAAAEQGKIWWKDVTE